MTRYPHEFHAVGNILACKHCKRMEHMLRPRKGDECSARLRERVAQLEAHVGSLHEAAARGMEHERAAVVAHLRGPCGDPAHHPSWCATCELRGDLADAVADGKHRG